MLSDSNQATSTRNSQWNDALGSLLLWLLRYTASFMGRNQHNAFRMVDVYIVSIILLYFHAWFIEGFGKKKKKEKTVNQICSDKKFANSHIPQGCKTGSHECGALTESRGSHVYEWFSQVYQASLLISSHISLFKQNLLMVGCWSHCFKGLCKCWWDARIQRKRTFRLLNITTGFSYFSLPGHINSL